MTSQPQEISIFLGAIEVENDVELRAYLDDACRDNSALRADVEALLVAHRKDNSFLDRPAMEPELQAGELRGRDVNPDVLAAGLAPTFGTGEAVVVGHRSHSVLQSLTKRMQAGTANVTLHDSDKDDSQFVNPTSTELPGTADSRYQLLGEIARGGMGAIIKGRDTDLGRDLAIKVLLNSHKHQPEYIQRFVEEAQIGGQLQHPGIVPVYELGQFSDERPFFTMKLVKGETLAALLAKRKSPQDNQPKLLGIFEQVCQTMAYAHSKGVIHRDLKPANIMVGSFGEVQVMDWGLSKVLTRGGVEDERKSLRKHRNETVIQTKRSSGEGSGSGVGSDTRYGSIMGTPAYMPPEQALGEVDQLDARADVFGLGAVLAEILTGKPAYVASEASQVFRMATRGELEDCRARLGACGAEPELLDIARTALSAEPEDRQLNAGELAKQITAHLEGVQERLRESERGRIQAQARSEEEHRRKKLYVAIGSLLLLIAVGSASAFAWIAENQRNLTLLETKRADAESQNAVEQEILRTAATLAARQANALRLVAESEKASEQFPVLSVRLALAAIDATRDHDGTILPAAIEAILNATIDLQGPPFDTGVERTVRAAISPDARWLVSGYKLLTVWDLKSSERPFPLRTQAMETTQYGGFWFFEFIDDYRLISLLEGSVRLWDLSQPDLLAASQVLVEDAVGVALSSDRKWLAIGTSDMKVGLWDLEARNFEAPRRVLNGCESTVNTFAFSGDGRWLAASMANRLVSKQPLGTNNAITVWDLEEAASTPAHVLRKDAEPGYGPFSMSLSPDGRWLAASGNPARVWDLQAEGPIDVPILLDDLLSRAYKVAISPNGQWLATTSFGSRGAVTLRELTDAGPAQNPKLLTNELSNAGLSDLEFSPNGRWLSASNEASQRALIWDMAAEDIKRSQRDLLGHEDLVMDATFSHDSNSLLTASWDGTVRRWDLTTNNPISDRILVLPENVGAVAFNRHASRIIAGCGDGNIWLWDFDAGIVAGPPTVLEGFRPNFAALGMNISADGRWLVACYHNLLRVWDLNSPNIGQTRRDLVGHAGQAPRWTIAPDSRWVVSPGEDNTIRVWDLFKDDPSASVIVLEPRDSDVDRYGVFVSPNGRWMAELARASAGGGSIRLWDFQKLTAATTGAGLEPTHTIQMPDSSANFCAFSPDGRWLVGSTPDSSHALLVDLQAPDVPGSLRHLGPSTEESAALQIFVAPDSRTALTFGWTGDINKWSFEDPDNAIRSILQGHSNRGKFMAVDSEFKRLVTGAEDSSAWVWDLSDTQSRPLVLRHPDVVPSVDISSDGRWVLTASGNTIRIWDLDVEASIARALHLAGNRELTEKERAQYFPASLDALGASEE